MALEQLVLTPPTGSSITLNGTKWGLLEFDPGNPSRRDELVTSTDASGAVPFRVAPRENREVTAKLQLVDATTMDQALNSIGDLEKMLELAEGFAANGPVDPVADCLRLVYTPAGSTQSYSLVVITGDITGVPRLMSGDDAGFFINRPVVTLRCICEPFAYGATRTYLDATTTTQVAPSVTVAGGPGDVSPWLRTAFKDVATQTRGRLIAGVKRGEASTSAVLASSGWTAIAGTFGSGLMSTVSTDQTNWQTLAQIPRQTRTGNFRIYAHRLSTSLSGRIRLAWSEAGSSIKRGPVIEAGDSTTAYIGEVNTDGPWDAWLETQGTLLLVDLVLIPVDSYLETSSPLGVEFLSGAKAAEDTLASTSTHIGGRTMAVGGSWTTTNSASPTWPVASTGASRTATGMSSPAFAQAGTGNHIALDIRANVQASSSGSTNPVLPVAGIYARADGTTNYAVLGVHRLAGFGTNLIARFFFVIAGTPYEIWWANLPSGEAANLRLQVTADGRYTISIFQGGTETASTSGHASTLSQGGTLGNASSAKAGLYDFNTGSSTRVWKNFSLAPLVGVTPAPIPSGTTLTQSGVRLKNSDGADYPYIGSSGLEISPNVNNNLTVVAQRSPVNHGAATDTDALDLDINGYPRFISVPHT